MTEELKQKAIDFEKNWFDKDITISELLIEFATEITKELQEELDYAKSNCLFSDCDRVVRLKSQNVDLEKQIEKMNSLKEIIIKAIREDNSDCVWEHAHNGKAKYIYAESVIDIINDKWEQK
jgi:hypothetical protein